MDKANLFRSLLPALTLALATVVGWIVRPIQFTTERPAHISTRLLDPASLQTLDARLWQDPFGPLRSVDMKEGSEPLKQAAQRFLALRQILAQPRDGRPCVIAAFVKNDGTVNDVELRLRARHAVLTGLGECGFVPADASHIGWFAAPWVRSRGTGLPGDGDIEQTPADANTPLLAAFEWFEAANVRARKYRKHENVLILWLDERDFSSHPLGRLAQLVAGLGWDAVKKERPFDLRVLGPRTSTGLVSLCEEASDAKGWRQPFSLEGGLEAAKLDLTSVLKGMAMYSATATVTDELLPPYRTPQTRSRELRDLSAPGLERRGRAWFAHRLDGWATFQQVIATDDIVTKELCRELALRGIAFAPESDDRVLLLSEWHSDYGRALPLTFAAHFDGREREAGGREFGTMVRYIQGSPDSRLPEGLIKVSYLSGVDGKLVASDQAQKPETKKGEGAVADLFSTSNYPPEGNSQLDYAERLATNLTTIYGERRVRAVGVLGSDVYDKLILLQALRAKFPEAVFFTTDLDARLLQSKYYEWTRNVVVASAYGLQATAAETAKLLATAGSPSKRRQVVIPPFRDCYQTSVRNAILLALVQPTEPFQPPPPRCFEVGRSGEPIALLAPAGAHSGNYAFSVSWPAVLTCALVLVPLGLAAFFWSLHHAKTIEPGWNSRLRQGALLLFAVAMIALSAASAPFGHLDHFTITAGVAMAGLGAFYALREQSMLWETIRPVPPMLERHWLISCAALAFSLVFLATAGLMLSQWWPQIGEQLLLEPFRWFEGVSLWPAQLVRILAGVLAVYWLLLIRSRLVRCHHSIGRYFFEDRGKLEKNAAVASAPSKPVAADLMAGTLPPMWRFQLDRVGRAVVEKLEEAGCIPEQAKVATGANPDAAPGETLGPPESPETHVVNARAAWHDYIHPYVPGQKRWLGLTPDLWPMRQLLLALSGAAIVFWSYVKHWQQYPPRTPYRGDASFWADRICEAFAVGFYLVLAVFVFDATWRALRLIRRIAAKRTRWPESLLKREQRTTRLPGFLLDGWLDVKLTGELTDTIGGMILFPFIVLALIVLSVNPLFDYWDIRRPDMVLLCVVSAAIPLVCGAVLCHVAERARDTAVEKLRFRLVAAEAQEREAGPIRAMIDTINAYRKGAFKPLYEQPYVLALLIPLGSSGGIELVRFFLARQ